MAKTIHMRTPQQEKEARLVAGMYDKDRKIQSELYAYCSDYFWVSENVNVKESLAPGSSTSGDFAVSSPLRPSGKTVTDWRLPEALAIPSFIVRDSP